MSDFNFTITAAAEQANRAIDEVEKGLGGIKRQADETTKGISGLGKGIQGAFAAAGGIALIHQLAEIDDEFTNLSNHALKFVDAGHDVSQILEEQTTLAHELHMGLETTLNAYDAVRDATDEMNLTHGQQIRLTQSLGEAATLSGKSVEGMADAMHGLKVAMETGQDPARVIRGLMKEYPDLAETWRIALGKTNKEIIDLADKGQLSFERLTDALIAPGDALDKLDKQFALRKVTWSQQWAELKHDLEQPIDWQGTIDNMYNVDRAILKVVHDLETQRELLEKLNTAGRTDITASYTPTRIEVPIKKTSDATRVAKEELSEYEKVLAAALETERKAINEYNLLSQALMNHPELYRQISVELGKRRDILLELGLLEAKSVTNGFAAPVNDTAGIDTEKLLAQQQAVVLWTDTAAGKTAKWNEELEKNKKTTEAWAAGLGSIAAEFVNMAETGDISLEKLGSSLAKLALQIAAMQIGGPWGALLGSFAGSVSLPGHATGGQFMVGGSGGTDSNLVAFRASANERVTVETPAQVQAGAFGGGGTSVTVVAQNNERDVIAASGTYAAQRVFVQNQRRFRQRNR
jgi:tape measure domain-containing protein